MSTRRVASMVSCVFVLAAGKSMSQFVSIVLDNVEVARSERDHIRLRLLDELQKHGEAVLVKVRGGCENIVFCIPPCLHQLITVTHFRCRVRV